MAYSMGGLDCRHLITHLKPVEYAPLLLTTIAMPHRGSPFMDWCKVHFAPVPLAFWGGIDELGVFDRIRNISA
jgi:hypothetical protein